MIGTIDALKDHLQDVAAISALNDISFLVRVFETADGDREIIAFVGGLPMEFTFAASKFSACFLVTGEIAEKMNQIYPAWNFDHRSKHLAKMVDFADRLGNILNPSEPDFDKAFKPMIDYVSGDSAKIIRILSNMEAEYSYALSAPILV